MTVGPIVAGIGLAALSLVQPGTTYLGTFLPAIVVFALGLALTVSPLTATVLAAAPVEHAGLASAVNNAVARAAGLIAVAVLPAAAGLSASSYLHPAAFASGFRTAMWLAGGACALGGVISAVTIRNNLTATPAAEESPHYSCSLDAPQLCPDEGDGRAGRRGRAAGVGVTFTRRVIAGAGRGIRGHRPACGNGGTAKEGASWASITAIRSPIVSGTS